MCIRDSANAAPMHGWWLGAWQRRMTQLWTRRARRRAKARLAPKPKHAIRRKTRNSERNAPPTGGQNDRGQRPETAPRAQSQP
eukprot:4186806-Alexandrium_andersonii.AAC.1